MGLSRKHFPSLLSTVRSVYLVIECIKLPWNPLLENAAAAWDNESILVIGSTLQKAGSAPPGGVALASLGDD